jgi:hypothetical protein
VAKKRIKNPIINAHPAHLTLIVTILCCIIALTVAIITSKAPIASSQKNVTSSNRPNNSVCSSHCQSTSSSWVPLKSEAPADVIAAIKQTDMYQTFMQQSNKLTPHSASTQGIDPIAMDFKTGTLGTPILVKPYRDDVGSLTYWVVPLLNSAKKAIMMLTFTYDPVNHRLQPSNFEGGDDFTATHPFPSVSQAAAVALVQRTEHVSVVVKGSKAPALIYFEWNPYVAPRAGAFHWTGGGTENINPIWRVAATNGRYYYVDQLGKQAYTGKSLPVDPSYLPAL